MTGARFAAQYQLPSNEPAGSGVTHRPPLMPCPGTLPQLLWQRAASHPEAAAIADPLGTLSNGAVLALVRRVREVLIAHGIQPGHRVAFVTRSNPASVRWMLGIGCHASFVPLDPALDQSSVATMLSRLQACLLVVDGPGTDLACLAAESLGIPVLNQSMSVLCSELECHSQACSLQKDHSDFARLGPEAELMTLSSSGTTGRPKLVPLSHESMLWRCSQKLHPDQVMDWRAWVNPMPMYHGFGVVSLLKTLISGGTFCALDRFDAHEVAEWIRRLDADFFGATPLIYSELLRAVQREPQLLGDWQPRGFFCSSAALAAQVLATILERFQAPVQVNYGMTEGALTVQVTCPGETASASVGRSEPGTVRVVDAAGRSVPVGEVGEVVTRGPTLFKGYVDDPELDAKAFREGWFLTGDLGRLDEHGNLYLTGRSSLLVNRGGAKVSPAEIEEWLLAQPGVRLAVALGVPHPTLGEDLLAAVVPHEGAIVDAAALRVAMLATMPAYKVPSRVVAVDDLPLGPAGKVRREGLAEHLQGMWVVQHRAPSGVVEERAQACLARALGREPDTISMDANFFELGGHSLLAARMLAALEVTSGQRVALARFMSEPTAQGLATLLDEGVRSDWPVDIEPHRTGEGVPLFGMPGYHGHAHYLRTLTPFLPPGFPVLGVSAPTWTPDDPMSIEQVAAHCAARIRTVQKRGPYRLLGYSYGGVVAHEVACQLQAQGEKIESLVLLDSPAGLNVFSGSPDTKAQQLRRQMARHCHRVFEGELVLFRTWSLPLQSLGMPALGWEYLARQGVAVFDLPTTHFGLAQAPGMAHWGPLLARVLAARHAASSESPTGISAPAPDARVPWQSTPRALLRARRDATEARWVRMLLIDLPALACLRTAPTWAAEWMLDLAAEARPWRVWHRLAPWIARRWLRHQCVDDLSPRLLMLAARGKAASWVRPIERASAWDRFHRPETRLLARAMRQHLSHDERAACASMDELDCMLGDRSELRAALVYQLRAAGWAEEAHRQAARFPPSTSASVEGEASGVLCLLAIDKQDWAEAARHAQRAVELLPMETYWYIPLVQALSMLGHRAKARQIHAQALDRFPDQWGYRDSLDEALM